MCPTDTNQQPSSPVQQAARTWFLRVSGVALCATGAAKVLSGFGTSPLLDWDDPLFGIRFRYLMLVVGTVEIAVAFMCQFVRTWPLSPIALAWLATSFVAYRLGLRLVGYNGACSCLGTLTDALHISGRMADNIMKGVLAYLLVGSYWLLLRFWREGRKP